MTKRSRDMGEIRLAILSGGDEEELVVEQLSQLTFKRMADAQRWVRDHGEENTRYNIIRIGPTFQKVVTRAISVERLS